MFRTFKYLSIILLIFALIKSNAQNPNWSPPSGAAFQFSANMISIVKLSDVVSNNANDRVAFFDDGAIRGLGNVVSLGNNTYLHFVTIYSNQSLDTFTIKFYHQNSDYVYEVQQPFIFSSQNITGTVSNPYIINTYPDNNAPIWITSVPAQETLEGFAFEPIDMEQFLVQPDGFPVAWTYTANANLNVNFQGNILNVNAIPGFVGQTSLTIRATEVSQSVGHEREASRYINLIEHFAEITIQFEVIPIYDAPLWHPAIPSQGILLGEMFDSIPLHNFENQYQGPDIIYDYVPVIEEATPIEASPTWQLSQNYGTTMSLVARLNYTPKYQFNHPNDVIAAFVGNEIRGVTTKNDINGLYYLSIGGGVVAGQVVTLKLYSGAMKKVLAIDSILTYQPNAIIGNDSIPHNVEFAPIVPIIPDSLYAGGIYIMPVNIIDTNFVGSMTFTFFAKDPAYPQYLSDATNASFCIVENLMDLTTYYQDLDGDGLGNPLISIQACSLPEGYVTNPDDCNDNDPNNDDITILVSETSGTPNDGKICAGSNVTLNVQESGISYLWNSGATTQSIQVNPTITSIYTVTVSLGGSCLFTQTYSVLVEGKVVKQSSNNGFNSLRNILECIIEGDTITYDFPVVNSTILTSELNIDKNVTIDGLANTKPVISIDYNTALNGLILSLNKTLTLNNVDINTIGITNQNTFSGPGNINITGSTKVSSQ